jgi:hypothetical protein
LAVVVSEAADRGAVPWSGTISQVPDVALGLGPCDSVSVKS